MSDENEFLFQFLEELDKKRAVLEDEVNQLNIEMTSTQDEINNITLKNNINNYYFLPMTSIDEQKKEILTKKIHDILLKLKNKEEQLSDVIKEHQIFSNVFKKFQLYDMNDIMKREAENTENQVDIHLGNGLGVQFLETQELERKRIARELHDSTVQNLTNFVHKTELCMKLVDIDTVRAKLELQTMIESIHHTIDDMREIIYNLRPMSIDDLGLIFTISRYINQLNDNYSNLKFSYAVIGEEGCNNSIFNLTLFRIIQEACNNAMKYSKGKNVVVTIEYLTDKIHLEVRDDGVGFNTDQLVKKRNITSGFGFSIMKERVYLLGGKIEILSKKNNGTKIIIDVPYIKLREEEE